MGECSLANTYHDIENASKNRLQLLGGEGEGLARIVDHLAHLADAFGALRAALMAVENVTGTRRARLDGRGDVTFAKAVAVADVQGAGPGGDCEWFAIAAQMRRMQVVRTQVFYMARD